MFKSAVFSYVWRSESQSQSTPCFFVVFREHWLKRMALGLLLLLAAPAWATSVVYTVNSASDSSSGTASNCTNSGNTCTLRDAIAAVNAYTSGAVSIVFDSTVFASAQTIALTNGQLKITNK